MAGAVAVAAANKRLKEERERRAREDAKKTPEQKMRELAELQAQEAEAEALANAPKVRDWATDHTRYTGWKRQYLWFSHGMEAIAEVRPPLLIFSAHLSCSIFCLLFAAPCRSRLSPSPLFLKPPRPVGRLQSVHHFYYPRRGYARRRADVRVPHG